MKDKISKRNYRQRAHSNPFKDVDIIIPSNPDNINWKDHFKNGLPPSLLDIGCGYGKFIMSETSSNILGLEIRDKVYQYVKAKTESLEFSSVMKTNALLFLPNIFHKSSLHKIFILFPDPHFKKRKQKGRVVCKQIIQIYDFILKDDGKLYISTDVVDLFNDMKEIILQSKIFKEVSGDNDFYYKKTFRNTDEALRAGLKTGVIYAAVFEKQ